MGPLIRRDHEARVFPGDWVTQDNSKLIAFLCEGDTPFEFLTYQLDGRIVAYHGNNG